MVRDLVILETDLPSALPLRRSELEVLFAWEGVILDGFRRRWTDWKYKGRPPAAPRLVSHDAWQSLVETRTARPEIVISNEARSYSGGGPYVSEVRRSKGDRPEWEVVTDAVIAEHLDAMTEELADALVEAITDGRRRKVRLTGGETLAMEIVL